MTTDAAPRTVDVTDARCRGCGSRSTARILDLGRQAASDYFPLPEEAGPDPRWPLELWLCRDCRLVQLGPVEPLLPEPVRAIESATSMRHARDSAADLMASEPGLKGATVYEFKSHHGGSWSSALADLGCHVLNEGSGERADLVVDVHALAHEPDVDMSLGERRRRMAPGGLLVLECHHLWALVRDNQFDTVRHGHWSVPSLTALQALAARHGLEPIQAVRTPAFGGSLRVVLAARNDHPVDGSVKSLLDEEDTLGVTDEEGLAALQRSAGEVADALRRAPQALQADGRRVLGYGAPSKATILLGVAGVGPDLVEFTVDASHDKHGRLVPGARLPIRPVEDLRRARPDTILLLTWDIADEVIGALEQDGGWGVLPAAVPQAARPRRCLCGHFEPAMNVVRGDLLGMLVFTPSPVHDDRGFFTRTFDAAVARETGMVPESLVQDSQSRSRRGVLRGLHFRNDGGEGKLVRCSRGRVFDVAVDLRPWSPTFRRWQSMVLDDVSHRSVWLPAGLAHGFLVLSDDADICYRIDRDYEPGTSATLRWDDPDVGITWPIDEAGVAAPLTSPTDHDAPPWASVEPQLRQLFPEPK